MRGPADLRSVASTPASNALPITVEREPRWITALVLVTLAALVGGCYLNTLHAPFVFDDIREVVENTSIRNLADFRTVLGSNRTRPLVNLSYAVDYARSRLETRAYHATNITLHVLNVCLLYWLGRVAARDWRRRSRDEAGTPFIVGLVAALLLAVHPLMTEAVTFVSSRAELLCASAFIGAILAGRRALVHPSAGRIAVLWFLFAVSLGSKELAVMVPVVLVLYDRWVLGGTSEERRARLRRVHLPMFCGLAVPVAARLWLLMHVEYAGDRQVSFRTALVEAELVSRYLRLFVWPVGLSVVHDVAPITSVASLRAVLAAGSIAAAGVLVVGVRSTRPLVAFGLAWFLLLLLPPAALAVLVQRSQFFAEHRAYLAGCGLFLCAGLGAEALWRRYSRAHVALLMVAAGTIALLVAATVSRNERWRHPMLLWGDAVHVAPRAWAAQYGYATALQDDGDYARAVEYHRRAIALRPQEAGPYQNLAICLIELRRPQEARPVLDGARRLAPNTPETLEVAARFAAVFGTPYELRAACAEFRRVAVNRTVPECRQ